MLKNVNKSFLLPLLQYSQNGILLTAPRSEGRSVGKNQRNSVLKGTVVKQH